MAKRKRSASDRRREAAEEDFARWETRCVTRNVPPPFQVRTSGVIDRKAYHSSPGTRQGDVMLTVFLAGRGIYRNRAGIVRIEKDMAGLVPPEDEGVLMAVPDDPYLHYWCRFNGEYAVWLAGCILRERGSRFFPISHTDTLADHLRKMGYYSGKELPARMGYREALLACALTSLIDHPNPESRPVLNAVSIRDYLRNHIDAPTDLVKMADDFSVSKTTLCRAAQAFCGDTIQRMHEEMKITWAKTLLQFKELNVAETAMRVGYYDPFYFSRAFKKRVGVSPAAWKKQHGSRSLSE